MPAHTIEQWKLIVKDYLLEQNAKINAARGAQNDFITLERIRKENIKFVQRMLPDFLPTIAE